MFEEKRQVSCSGKDGDKSSDSRWKTISFPRWSLLYEVSYHKECLRKGQNISLNENLQRSVTESNYMKMVKGTFRVRLFTSQTLFPESRISRTSCRFIEIENGVWTAKMSSVFHSSIFWNPVQIGWTLKQTHGCS
jgi:hypothetical protein